MKFQTSSLFWSVMIPTYRPAEIFLRQTLDSILQQDPGSEFMQITVVDDCSPNVDVEKMVASIGGSRVGFHRNPSNLGLAGCWNACIDQALGQWVHILHQDDYVLAGFYKRLTVAAVQHPQVALLATRSLIIDEQSLVLGVTLRQRGLEEPTNSIEVMMQMNPLQCPGVVVKRSFYQAFGTFRTDLVYALDYEMWTRVFFHGGGILIPEVLSCYRQTSKNASARLNREAKTLEDAVRLIHIFGDAYTQFDRKKGRKWLRFTALDRIQQFRKAGDTEAVEANRRFWRENNRLATRMWTWTRWLVRRGLLYLLRNLTAD